VELGFTTALTFFVVAALASLRPARVDAVLIVVVFVIQLVYPTPFTRFAAGFVLIVFAIDLLVARRRQLRPMFRAIRSGNKGR
jgi:cation:H+ antiporter